MSEQQYPDVLIHGKTLFVFLAISFVEVAVGMFLFLLPGHWKVLTAAESALFYSALLPRSYLVVAFVGVVNVALIRNSNYLAGEV